VLRTDDGYRAQVEALLEVCAERRVAVQTIKSVAKRRWRDDDDRPRFSWYEPIEGEDAVGRAVRYVLGRPQLFLNSSSDVRLLRTTLEAAAAGGPVPSDDEMRADVADQAITPLFDGGVLDRI
jgi:hypothetical protein